MGSWKKWLINVAVFAVLSAFIAYYVLHEQDPRVLFQLLDRANGWYWIGGISLVVLFISCESVILRLMLLNAGSKPAKGRCLLYSFIGFFFSAITPAAGGGQPAQVYYMNKDKLDPGITSPILVVVTVGYKVVLVLYGIVAFIIRPSEIMNAGDVVLTWAGLGFALNIIVVCMLLIAVFKTDIMEKILRSLMRIIGRFVKPRRMARYEKRLECCIDNYHKSTECIKSNPKLMAFVFIISIIQRSLLFAIPWLVLRSFGITGHSLPVIIMMQSLVSLGTDLLPLPGGSGAHEALFVILFDGICGENLVLPILIASRGISFYAQLVICGIISLIGIRHIIGHKNNTPK